MIKRLMFDLGERWWIWISYCNIIDNLDIIGSNKEKIDLFCFVFFFLHGSVFFFLVSRLSTIGQN